MMMMVVHFLSKGNLQCVEGQMGWWQQLRGREGCAHHIIFIVLIVLVLVPVLVLVIMVLIDHIIMLKFQLKSYISCTKSQHMGWRHRQLSGQSGNVAKRIQWGECDWSSDPIQCNWSSCCNAMQLKQQSSSASCIALECTGCFCFHWYPPKKLKYGKPTLGESTLT